PLCSSVTPVWLVEKVNNNDAGDDYQPHRNDSCFSLCGPHYAVSFSSSPASAQTGRHDRLTLPVIYTVTSEPTLDRGSLRRIVICALGNLSGVHNQIAAAIRRNRHQ